MYMQHSGSILRNACVACESTMCDYQESGTTRQTDARQSDPYVPLCFAGHTTMMLLTICNEISITRDWQPTSASVDSGRTEGLPHNGLADVGSDKERNTRAQTIAFLKQLVE